MPFTVIFRYNICFFATSLIHISNLFHFMQRIILLYILLGLTIHVGAQTNTDLILSKKFLKYDIIQVNTNAVYASIVHPKSTRTNEYTLQLNEATQWHLNLTKSDIIADDYTLTVKDDSGVHTSSIKPTCIPMQGYVVGNPNSTVSLTFDRDFIYGFIEVGNVSYYIEPLNYFIPSAEKSDFIMYSTNDIIEDTSLKCGYELQKEKLEAYRQNAGHHSNDLRTGLCYFIRYAIAADYSMVQQYGSVAGVQNHNIGVVNNVQTNYDDDFADQFTYQISEQWISNCTTCDPWTSSTDSGAFLDDFTAWAISGFTTTHDIGGCWSHRDFDGGTIGLAWVGTVCTQYRYHVLQDFSTNANLKRVMNAHEIGHNFDASHNTGIMAPSVSNTNTWSGTSINEIENFYMSLSCLDNCTSPNPPLAEFNYSVNSNCAPASVSFINLSSNASTYLWEFEGGTPSTSTAFEPTVTWDESGTYNVTLTAYDGASSNTVTLPIVLDVIQLPESDFTYTNNGNSVTFSFLGSNAYTFSWDFGDGSPVSSEPNPTHTYAVNGNYTVTLTVTNPCGTSSNSYNVLVQFSPTPAFSATPLTGCTPMVVTYTNTSTNATNYEWQFPGGNPATSTEASPIVVYNTAGTFDVTLTAFNDYIGQSEVKTGYINVGLSPTSSFTYTVNGLTAAFNNTSQNGNNVLWEFGDGITSTQNNPTHTYASNGEYTVTLSNANDCGTVMSSQTLALGIAPIAGFSSSATSTCTGTNVQFTSTSTNQPTTYAWTFEGGTPATSSQQNPVVSYAASGTYDVSLTVTNAYGTNTYGLNDYITVTTTPTVNFDYVGNALSVNFTSQIQNGTVVNWNFGDGGTSTESNPTHTFAAQGTYNVTLSAQNNCGTITYSENVIVQLLPSASFQPSATAGCTPASIQFTSTVSPSVTAWLWTFEGGNPATSTLPNPMVTYNNTGTFDVTLVVTNNAGSTTVIQNDIVVINTNPTAGFSTNVAANTLNVTNTGVGASNTTYVVQGPNGFSTTVTSATASIPLPLNGVYSIQQTNTNACGTATTTSEITLNAFTTSGFSLPSQNYCEGASITIDNQSTNATSYSWTANGASPATSTDQNPQFTYMDGGSYIITLIATNALGSDTSEINIAVGYLPESVFSFITTDATVQFSNSSLYQNSVSWNFGDGSVSSDANPTHTYSTSGTYPVKLIASNGCGSDTTIQNVTVQIVATDDTSAKANAITLYPNPANDFIHVDCSVLPSGTFTFSIKDVLGRVIDNINYTLQSDQKIITLPCKDIHTNGTYILQISGNGFHAVKSFVIVK